MKNYRDVRRTKDKFDDIEGSALSIVADPADMFAYVEGARGEVGVAALVLRPATIEELSELVSACVTNGI